MHAYNEWTANKSQQKIGSYEKLPKENSTRDNSIFEINKISLDDPSSTCKMAESELISINRVL